MFDDIYFANSNYLWLLLILPLALAWHFFTWKKKQAVLKMPSLLWFQDVSSIWSKVYPFLFIMRLVAIGLIILAISRPQTVDISTRTKTNKGIDIVMAIDVSSSMLSQDLKPDRLTALKRVAETFVEDRVSDRIGLVVYAGESFTQTPITSDKSIVKRTISEIKWGQLDGGTAIGMGLGSAVNRLKDSKAKSKVIILLTDGVNNSGNIDPKTASELAKELGIKVYTIGIGTNGMAPFPWAKDPRTGKLSFRNQQVEIDEKLLKFIATETNGKYFRATDNSKLKAIYNEIDKLEKTKIEEFKYYNYQELYRYLVFVGLGFLLIEFILKNTLFKSFI